MKTVAPFKWAESNNYAGGTYAGTATKITPPASFSTDGVVPADRYAAQWENYVKNLTGLALQTVQLEELSYWNRLLSATADSTGWLWNPSLKVWVQPGSTNTVFRDISGSVIRSAAQATLSSLNLSGSTATFSAAAVAGLGATSTRRFTLATTGTSAPLLPTVDTPTSGTTLVFTGFNVGKPLTSDTNLYWVGTSTGTWSVLSLQASGTWTATAITSPGTGITGSASQGIFFSNPVSNDFFLIGSDQTNTTIYKWTSGSPGTWATVYNGASLFGGGVLLGPPLYDAPNNQFVFAVNATVTRASDNTATRFKTKTYRTSAGLLTSATLDKTTTGIGIGPVQDLGSGCAAALCHRFQGLSTTPSNHATVSLCITADYGATWRLPGYDLDMVAVLDTAGTTAGMYNGVFSLSSDSCVLNFVPSVGGSTTTLGLLRPGTDMATFVGV